MVILPEVFQMQLKSFVTFNQVDILIELLINFREFHSYQLVTLGGGLGDRGEEGGGGVQRLS